MAWIVWSHTAPTVPNRQRNCCRKSSTLPYRPEINLYAAYHAVHDESTIQSRRPLQIRPEQPTPSLQNCHAHSLRPQKRFSQLTTYLAYFSVTYLATSLKLAKFSVTERTAGLSRVPSNFAQIILFSLLYMQRVVIYDLNLQMDNTGSHISFK